MTWFYNILIGLFGLVIASLTFADEIASKIIHLKAIKSLIFKIPVFVFASIVVIWATVEKDNENEKSAKNELSSLKAEIARRDSIYSSEKKIADSTNQKKIMDALDSSYAKSIRESNNALAKYNLILVDSLNRVSNKINLKSSNAQLAVRASTKDEQPIYTFMNGNRKELRIKIESLNGTCYNPIINCYYIKLVDNGFRILHYELQNTDGDFLAENRFRTLKYSTSYLVNKESQVIVLLLGSFSRDVENKQIIPYREAFEYSFVEDKFLAKIGGRALYEISTFILNNKLDK